MSPGDPLSLIRHRDVALTKGGCNPFFFSEPIRATGNSKAPGVSRGNMNSPSCCLVMGATLAGSRYLGRRRVDQTSACATSRYELLWLVENCCSSCVQSKQLL
jgi:hypothetical protein